MANFIGLVYATLKNEGIDTKGMDTDEAVAKYNELQKKGGGKAGEKEGTPAENRKLKQWGIDKNSKEDADYSHLSPEGEAIKKVLQNRGIKINNDNTVNLYHTTLKQNVEKIKKDGFKGTMAPIGGMVHEEIGERSFFGFDKDWVENTWGSGEDYETLEIKVPIDYIRQGAGNKNEVYIEGDIRPYKNNVWIPNKKPTSTFYDRLAMKGHLE